MKLLIVGNGESCKDRGFIGSFDGKVIACDTTAHVLIDKGIMPDYVTWLETDDVNVEFLVISIIPRLKDSIVVCRRGNYPRIYDVAKKHNVSIRQFSPPTYVNNVGLFSMIFAQEVLHCKEMHLLGMEHRGGNYSEGWYGDMLGAFSRWYPDRDKRCEIIDHSINGRLFS